MPTCLISIQSPARTFQSFGTCCDTYTHLSLFLISAKFHQLFHNTNHAAAAFNPRDAVSLTSECHYIIDINTTDLFDFFLYQMIGISRNERLKLAVCSIVADRLPCAPAVLSWIILAWSRTFLSGKVGPLAAHHAPVYAFVLLCSFRVNLQREHNCSSSTPDALYRITDDNEDDDDDDGDEHDDDNNN